MMLHEPLHGRKIGSVGDAPRADVVIEILLAIGGTRVDVSPALAADLAFLFGLDDAAAADRIGVIAKLRQVP
jgi:hypothetical protein